VQGVLVALGNLGNYVLTKISKSFSIFMGTVSKRAQSFAPVSRSKIMNHLFQLVPPTMSEGNEQLAQFIRI
jgi:hypothetical protein